MRPGLANCFGQSRRCSSFDLLELLAKSVILLAKRAQFAFAL